MDPMSMGQGMIGLGSSVGSGLGFGVGVGGFHVGSGSNISDYDRIIRSAAQKYRHMIPTSEAIEEEAENVTRVAPNGGMFRRNENLGEEEDDFQQRGRLPTGQSQEKSINRQYSINRRGKLPPTALQKHQQASRQGLILERLV